MAQHGQISNADKAAPTHVEIYTIAQKSIDIFKSHGLRACIFGSTACSLHGIRGHTPNDVDIVVFASYQNAEVLKWLLVNGDTNFFFVPSQARRATHKVLWHQLRPRGAAHHRKCKVDILLPGEATPLHVPLVPKAHVTTINGLPVMPLFPLLLLRLQGWEHHRESRRADFRAKVPADVAAIETLLLKVAERGMHITQPDLGWLSRDVVEEAKRRAEDYAKVYLHTENEWYDVGLLAQQERRRWVSYHIIYNP